jgi:two-component system NtrC family sensor kinase
MFAISNLKFRGKLLVMVLPLVVVPVLVMGGVIGFGANEQARSSITRTSKDDLDHMAQFTLDLLNAHHQQFQVYQEDKRATIRRDLETLVRFARTLVEEQERQRAAGTVARDAAQAAARDALKGVNVGETGYLYAMTSGGTLVAHLAQEGENIYDATDEAGRPFIREICESAVAAAPGQVLATVYPWRNAILGDRAPRQKVVAYQYYAPWDWIIAAGSYLDETVEDAAFQRRAFAELKERIKAKRVGETGYIYAMTRQGVLTIHPFLEGTDLSAEQDDAGRPFIREMCETRQGWIRYPWRNRGEPRARMKIVRYVHFEPWDWIVAVGSYEGEFYSEAQALTRRIRWGVFSLTLAVGLVSAGLVLGASEVLARPVRRMIGVVREVRGGNLEAQMEGVGRDELGELGTSFNQLIQALRRDRELETSLAQQEKLSSLGVLASRVAHEINNPIGVILGYAAHLEGNLDPEDPNYPFVQEIRQESQRCKGIVQDLLQYVRAPRPAPVPTDLNALVGQLLTFAAGHTDLHGVTLVRELDPSLPPVALDPDPFRQVALNLLLTAAQAAGAGGLVTVGTRMADAVTAELWVGDDGPGIEAEQLEMVFEPFFTTREGGTGLGLAISRQIVERHGGRIRFDTQSGQGTTVRVTLPREHREF